MTAPDAGATPKKPVRNPAPSFIWAAAWLLVTVLGVVFLVAALPTLASPDVHGKGLGVAFVIPLVSAIIVIVIVVSAVRRMAAWRELVASTTPAQRRAAVDQGLAKENVAPMLTLAIVLLVLWIAFVVLVLVGFGKTAPSETTVLLDLIVIVAGAILWIGALGLALRRRAARARVGAAAN